MKCRAAPDTAILPSSLSASRRAKRRPTQYDGLKPPNAWNVPTFTVSDASSIVGDRNGTSGSWKWRMSNRCASSTSRTWRLKRSPRVTRPTEPLAGAAQPVPRRMMCPSLSRWRPYLLVMIHTSWPIRRMAR
jgi:hypothetical protein